MAKYGQFNKKSATHRKIIRLLAQCHANAEAAEMVGVSVITIKRVRYSPAGQEALADMSDELDTQAIRLHSAHMVLKAL